MDTRDTREETRGNLVQVHYGRHKVTVFAAGEPRRYEIEPGYAARTGEVEIQDGTRFWAILEVDEKSSGELCGCGLFLPGGGMVFQHTPQFEAALAQHGIPLSSVFPYRYRYDRPLSTDHHIDIDQDGWSRRSC